MRPILLLLLLVGCNEVSVSAVKRNKLVWPFDATSIWNTPIGTGARYVPADIKAVQTSTLASSFLISTNANDPLRPLVRPMASPDRCGGTDVLDMIRMPDAFVLSAGQNEDPGNSAAIVQPDGHSLIEISGFGRCALGGPVIGYRYPDSDLRRDGRLGGQGGSGLSSLGGALTPAELLDAAPVRHALKVALSSALYYFADPSRPESCFRWPADRCDAGFAAPGDRGYHGVNPALTMGALLAIPDTIEETSVSLETDVGRAMFFTLQNYGAYVVGSAGVDWAIWGARDDARAVFLNALGAEGRAAWIRDVNRLLPLLAVVANNAPDAIGGGGVARQIMAPPLAD